MYMIMHTEDMQPTRLQRALKRMRNKGLNNNQQCHRTAIHDREQAGDTEATGHNQHSMQPTRHATHLRGLLGAEAGKVGETDEDIES